MTAPRGRARRLFAGLLAGLLVSVPAGRSAEAPKAADPGFAEDVQDVLFFSETRPVLIRLHVLVDGKPYATRWTEYLSRWFRFLDRDEDGYLGRDEVARAPSVPALKQMVNNPYTFQPGNSPSLEELDWDHDNRVSLAEFLRFYRHSSAGPVQLAPAFNQFIPGAGQDTLTETLFTLLDADKDGKLSQAELAAAESVLRKYDVDDDELVTMQELSPGVAATPVVRRPQPLVPAMQAPAMPLMLMPREDAPRRIATRLRVAKGVIARCDKNKNGTLSREEVGMPKELFDHLDANKDGELDSIELLRWVIVTPDAEVVLRLGRIDGERDPVEAIGKANLELCRTASAGLAFSTGESRINLIAASTTLAPQVQSIRQVLVQQFKTIDQKNKGYLTQKQLREPQFTVLRSILGVADRDEDDCLSLEELTAWVDLTASGMYCQTTVALAANGRGLFQILDANQDGRLSIRELRNAWTRLAPYNRDKGRSVSRNEIPLQYQIVVTAGVPTNFAGQLGRAGQPGVSPADSGPGRGPVWFRKMDRNGDGDVSRNEFLGTREDFRRLDTDGDGLISLEEALRAEAALRKK